jgi:hypothetical protein
MTDKKLVDILTEDMQDEIANRMPEWFRILSEAYKKKQLRQMLS